MKTLFSYRHAIRENLLPFLGLCICLYFSYHALYGNRSLIKWLDLNYQTATLSQIHDDLVSERDVLDKKVSMMRPGSLDQDLLEERVRLILGYKHPDELVIMRN
jgi:cell division protein FtsB